MDPLPKKCWTLYEDLDGPLPVRVKAARDTREVWIFVEVDSYVSSESIIVLDPPSEGWLLDPRPQLAVDETVLMLIASYQEGAKIGDAVRSLMGVGL